MSTEGAIMFFAVIFSPFWLPPFLKKRREKIQQREFENEENPEIDIEELSEAVDELQEAVQQIKKMQEAVHKIDSCEPDRLHSNFQMRWQSEDGKNQSYDFWADGDSPTNDILRQLYQTETDRLTTSLPELAEKIHDITNAE